MTTSDTHVPTECFLNHSTEFFAKMKQDREDELDAMYRKYYGWLPIPIAMPALILAMVYVLAVCRCIESRRVSRKCYALLVNRTIGGVLSCLAALTMSVYSLVTPRVNHDVMTVLENLFIGGVWSGMVSYISLSILKFYSVWKPLCYRGTITMKHCMFLIALSWIIFAVLISCSLTILALIEVPSLHRWSGCKYETCFRVMHRTRCAIAVVVYFSTLIVYAVTVVYIKRAQPFIASFRRRDQLSSEKRSRFPLWKLTLNVSTYGVLSLFYMLWCLGLLIHGDNCFFLRNFVPLMRLLGIIRCTLLFQVMADPIIAFITDAQVRWGFYYCFGSKRNVSMTGSGSYQRNSTLSEEAPVRSAHPSAAVMETTP